jgi:NAD(P)-dependent dehydrogenase (short-subunit alcohol dehydrogenase family)
MSDGTNPRVAVVTGGARGIGEAYVEGFARRGDTVVIADNDVGRAKETLRRLRGEGLEVYAQAVDVGDQTSVATLFEWVETTLGRVDFLINNAAIMLDLQQPFKPFWQTQWSEWCRILEVNAGGVFLCCREVWPMMSQQQSGRIVNISSDAIWKGYDLQLAYFASKGAVATMTKCLAREFGSINVNVNAIAPGFTLSESVLQSSFMQEVARPSVAATLAIKHEQQPKDLVGTALFLCGPESRCITGQTIVVNGGAVMV